MSVGSPSEGELRRGDVVTKINGRPTSEMTHREGVDLIKNAGNTISLVVQRYFSTEFPIILVFVFLVYLAHVSAADVG